MKYNLDYLSDVEFDLMTEDELNEYLDAKAEWIRKNYVIRPLTNYHKKLATLMSGLDYEINKPKSKTYGRSNRNNRKPRT